MIYLDERQVHNLVKEAEREGEVISIRCIRKTKGDADKGTKQGELHTLMCTTKPEYVGSGDPETRKNEDSFNHVLTVWAVNRKTGSKPGAWRRVNLAAVQEVRYKEEEFRVVHS
jgi:hypothetical protein